MINIVPFKYHPDAVFEVDLEGYIVSANVASEKITGFLERYQRAILL
jgi:PAS domain-containing protein